MHVGPFAGAEGGACGGARTVFPTSACLAGHYLLSVDATRYFSSSSVHCDNCCKKHHKDGHVHSVDPPSDDRRVLRMLGSGVATEAPAGGLAEKPRRFRK